VKKLLPVVQFALLVLVVLLALAVCSGLESSSHGGRCVEVPELCDYNPHEDVP
jgi:hypothetical protein